MTLDVLPTPVTPLHVLSPSRWLIRLAITAKNTDASTWETHVEFDGSWGSNIWVHLSVTPPKRVHLDE